MKNLFRTKVATNVRKENGYTIIRYHNTDVVKFNDQEIILRNNGWKTVTTKSRMNETSRAFKLDYAVFQRDFKWYIDYKGHTIPFGDVITLKR